MGPLTFDIAHVLAGTIVLLSFVLLYQDRLPALINVFAFQSLILSASVAWQALAQDAPHLLITAAIAFGFKRLSFHSPCIVWCADSTSIATSRRWAASVPPCSSEWRSSALHSR